jgi:hypothetical protein
MAPPVTLSKVRREGEEDVVDFLAGCPVDPDECDEDPTERVTR